MARQRRPRTKTAGRKSRRASSVKKPGASTPWPTIEEFFEYGYGSVSLGAIPYSSLPYTAVVTDDSNMLVALVRKPGETLHQLLNRLEQALGPALEDQVYVDEVNKR